MLQWHIENGTALGYAYLNEQSQRSSGPPAGRDLHPSGVAGNEDWAGEPQPIVLYPHIEVAGVYSSYTERYSDDEQWFESGLLAEMVLSWKTCPESSCTDAGPFTFGVEEEPLFGLTGTSTIDIPGPPGYLRLKPRLIEGITGRISLTATAPTFESPDLMQETPWKPLSYEVEYFGPTYWANFTINVQLRRGPSGQVEIKQEITKFSIARVPSKPSTTRTTHR